jgi:hypothetical protein
MGARVRNWTKSLALIAAGAVLATSVWAVAAKKPLTPAKRAPTPAHSIRDTGVGLPRINSHGTLGVGEFVPAVTAYHDSGSYNADLATVDGEAQTFMERQAKAVRAKAKRVCGSKKPKKSKKCKQPQLALVLDIDETSLSNYQELSATGFSNAAAALVSAVATADSPAIAPTLQLYQRARQMGIAVFMVTGRPQGVETLTRQNLTAAGYTDIAGLYQKPSSDATIAFKSNARATIEGVLGYRIIVNVGDQESDLTGGFADRTFKLPNPFYFIE